jgi:hypothetical protein
MGLTTADAEIKCDVEKGVIQDEHLWDGMAINSGTRNNIGKSLGEGRGEITYSDKRTESTEAVIMKG